MLPLVIGGAGAGANPVLTASEAIAGAGCPTAPLRVVAPRTRLEAEAMQGEIAGVCCLGGSDPSTAATTMVEVRVGVGRIVALCHRSSTAYHIH
jgi:hypothetical protein